MAIPEDELPAGPDELYDIDIDPEPDTVTCVVLVMVEVRTTLEVEELDEPVMAPAVLLPDEEELLAYEDAIGVADEEPDADPLTGDDMEVEPAGTMALDDEDVGLEYGVEAAPLDDEDSGFE